MKTEIKVARLQLQEKSGACKAIADIVINDDFLIKGFRVVKGNNGLFIGSPRENSKDGKWYATSFPLTTEIKEDLTKAILSAYEENKEGK